MVADMVVVVTATPATKAVAEMVVADPVEVMDTAGTEARAEVVTREVAMANPERQRPQARAAVEISVVAHSPAGRVAVEHLVAEALAVTAVVAWAAVAQEGALHPAVQADRAVVEWEALATAALAVEIPATAPPAAKAVTQPVVEAVANMATREDQDPEALAVWPAVEWPGATVVAVRLALE
jgi:hypothetical protein